MRFLVRSRLAWRMVALTTLLSAVPVVVLGIVSYHSTIAALENEAARHLSSIAELHGHLVLELLEERKSSLRFLASSQDLATTLDGLDGRRVGAMLDPVRANDLRSSAFVDPSVRMDALVEKHLGGPGPHDLWLLDATRDQVLYSATQEADHSVGLGGSAHLDTGLAKLRSRVVLDGQTAIEKFSSDAPHGEPAMFIGAPVFDPRGEVRAVVALGLDRDDIDRAIRLDTSAEGEPRVHVVADDRRTPADDDRDIPVISAHSPVGLVEALGTDFEWTVVVEIERRRAIVGAATTQGVLLWSIGLLTVLALVAGVLFARGFTRPLESAASALATATTEISSTASQMVATATETATAVSQTTTTTEEVKQTAEQSISRAALVAADASRAAETAVRGKQATDDSRSGMGRLQAQMEGVAQAMVTLSEQNQIVGGIIDVVNDIADQSNLLAVNASIEAAKAGELGRGFAVVAQEVRNLADQSREATAQVRAILGDVQKATSGAVMSTEQGLKAVEEAARLVAVAGESIDSLAGTLEGADRSAQQIHASAHQQSLGMVQVAQAMGHIHEASAQNAAGLKQLKEAAHSLEGMGQTLTSMV